MTKSKSGFTLIELLVVIGILAVLAAIAIPAVAGLIDRANVAADNTNANEMTNAIERFASEYELYKQDVACGIVKEGSLDALQGRVFNVTGTTTRDGLGALEGSAYDNDTFYPITREEARQVIETYVKTSSATFDPKQSDKCFWYCPSAGIVVAGNSDATAVQLNELVPSGKDAKGNTLTADTQWIDLTCGEDAGNGGSGNVGGDVSADRDWRNDPYQSNRGFTAELNGTVYSFEIMPVEGQTGNYHFENGLNPQGIDYNVKLHTVSGSVVDLTAEEQEILASGNLAVWSGDHVVPAFVPYGTKTSSGTQKFVPSVNSYKCGCENVCGGQREEYLTASNTYDLTSAEYDEATENIVFTFSNGIKVLSPALYTNYGRPYIQIDGQWYRWEYHDTFEINEYTPMICSVEPLVAVSESAIDSFYYNIKNYVAVFDESLDDNAHNGVYGSLQLSFKGSDYKEIGYATKLDAFYADIVDASELSQDVLDAIGGDIDNVSLTNMCGYKKDGHTNSCINPLTMSEHSASMSNATSEYDSATDTTTVTFNTSNSSLCVMRIRNASNPVNAIFEFKYTETKWVEFEIFG